MITPEQFRFFADLVKASSGIALGKGKEYLLESRLNELAKVLGLKDLNELYRRARFQMTPKLKDQIIEAMTTNETYFFRDQHPFDALKNEIVPELMANNNGRKQIRFWSAACSTGQEPYSIAMTLSEHFPGLSTWNTEILATDISQQAIQKGQAGRFTQVEVNRGLPVTLLIKYFKQQGAFWIVDSRLKENMHFRRLNLLQPFVGIRDLDVIFCRYVLIYFDKQTKKQIIEKLVKVLRPGGYLILGATETPVGMPSAMQRRTFGRALYWQKNP